MWKLSLADGNSWAFTEDDTVWSKQIISHSHYTQIQHILWPKALFAAATNGVKLFYDLKAIKVKEALGVELAPKEKQLRVVSAAVRTQIAAKAKQDQAQEEQNGRNSRLDKHNSGIQQHVQQQSGEKLGPPEDKSGSRSESTSSKRIISIAVPVFKLPTWPSDMVLASRMFVGTLVQAWQESKLDQMPPGCCFLVGHVELIGSEGRCKMGVLAAYDPKGNSFKWVKSQVKRTWAKQQVAKKG